jgi:hypothetical protein
MSTILPLLSYLASDNVMAMRSRSSSSLNKFVSTLAAPSPKTLAELKARNRLLTHSDASIAVEWLNATKGTEAYRRVLAVRQELEELGAMLDGLTQQRQAAKDRHPRKQQEWLDHHAELMKLVRIKEQFRQRHNAFNQLLSRYTFVPALTYNLDAGVWRFNTIPKRTRGPELALGDTLDESNRNRTLSVRVNEPTVVAALARLAAKRELSKVRLCEACRERWRVRCAIWTNSVVTNAVSVSMFIRKKVSGGIGKPRKGIAVRMGT